MIKQPGFHFVSFGRRYANLSIALKFGVIGSKSAKFQEYLHPGDNIFIHCDGKIWGLATLSSGYMHDPNPLWENDLYPHRFAISVKFLTNDPIVLAGSDHALELRKTAGAAWAYSFLFVPKLLPSTCSSGILEDLERRNKITSVQFQQYLVDASLHS